MKRIALFGRIPEGGQSGSLLKLAGLLWTEGLELVFYEGLKTIGPQLEATGHAVNWFSHRDELKSVDLLISMGGDGTMLETITLIRDSGLPVLGINTGRLGFLASVSLTRLEEAAMAVVNGRIQLESRGLIRVSCAQTDLGDFSYALNEVTIHKKDTAAMISIHVEVDGHFMNTYWADGLIICTPTGSTAYSLSCGGPIVMPGSENLIFTPIAPHNLNVRPVVIPNGHKVSLKSTGRDQNLLLTLDSRSWTIDNTCEIILDRAPFNVQLAMLEGQSFFGTIRNKLMWGIDRRN